MFPAVEPAVVPAPGLSGSSRLNCTRAYGRHKRPTAPKRHTHVGSQRSSATSGWACAYVVILEQTSSSVNFGNIMAGTCVAAIGRRATEHAGHHLPSTFRNFLYLFGFFGFLAQ